MNHEEIRNIIRTKGTKYFFGPQNNVDKGNYTGFAYIEYDSNKIKFSTDTMDYSMDDQLDEVLEDLYHKFKTNNFEVKLHIHPGHKHDFDVFVQVEEDLVPEIIAFIMNHFYRITSWDFRVE